MADLFIVRLRLKASLWSVAALLVGCLFGTWDAWNRIGLGGEGEPRFFLFASVSGALALALAGLFIVYLTIGKLMQPVRGQVDRWWERVPWWAVRVAALLLLIGAGAVALLQLSARMADGFTLLKKERIAELGEYIDTHPEALEQKDKKSGRTLLESALASGQVEAVELLLSREGGAATNLSGWVVAMLDNLPMVETLLRHGADPNVPDAADRVPVYYAARSGNATALAMLLDSGADVDAPNASSQTPLLLAIMEDNLPAARLLVEQGADPDRIDRSGETVLHKAVRRRNADAVRYLLENGADPGVFNFKGMAPIHIAALDGQDGLVEILLEEPGQVGLRGKANRTAFDYALRRHRYDTARLLLENGAQIDRIMEDGYTATHIMLVARDYEAVKFLIEEGADVRIADNKGETAYFYMRKKKLQNLLDQVDARDNPEAAGTNAVESADSP